MEKHFNKEPFMSPQSFCRLFPFHVIFDKNLVITQCGNSISRLMPQLNGPEPCKLSDIFTIIRPHINLDYQSIRSQIMSVFVLCTRSNSTTSSPTKSTAVVASAIATAASATAGLTSTDLVVATSSSSTTPHSKSTQDETGGTRFKGQMVYLSDKELILFQCSPSVMSLDDLIKYKYKLFILN